MSKRTWLVSRRSKKLGKNSSKKPRRLIRPNSRNSQKASKMSEKDLSDKGLVARVVERWKAPKKVLIREEEKLGVNFKGPKKDIIQRLIEETPLEVEMIEAYGSHRRPRG